MKINLPKFRGYESPLDIYSLLVLPEYSKNKRISFYNLNAKRTKKSLFHSKNKHEDSLFLLQTIQIDSEKFNLFYDTGCQDSVSKKEAVNKLELLRRASSQLPGPITLFGVGNQKSVSKHGIYSVKLLTFDGGNAMISGICLDRITTEFPIYPLKGDKEEDIHKSYRLKGLNVEDLPNLPLQVGGETGLMIGIQYLKYYPEQVFKLPSGLTIHRSYFDGR